MLSSKEIYDQIAKTGKEALAYLKEQKTDFDRIDDTGNTPLSFAITQGDKENFETVALLLIEEAKVDVNKIINQGKYSKTPLFMAAEKGSSRIIEALLRHGAEKTLNMTCIEGMSPLIVACCKGNVLAANCLIDAKAAINLDHPTALHAIAWSEFSTNQNQEDKMSIIQTLLEKERGLFNFLAQEGTDSPLQGAIKPYNDQVAIFLLQMGGKISTKNLNLIVEKAIKNGCIQFLTYLLTNYGKDTQAALTAAIKKCVNLAELENELWESFMLYQTPVEETLSIEEQLMRFLVCAGIDLHHFRADITPGLIDERRDNHKILASLSPYINLALNMLCLQSVANHVECIYVTESQDYLLQQDSKTLGELLHKSADLKIAETLFHAHQEILSNFITEVSHHIATKAMASESKEGAAENATPIGFKTRKEKEAFELLVTQVHKKLMDRTKTIFQDLLTNSIMLRFFNRRNPRAFFGLYIDEARMNRLAMEHHYFAQMMPIELFNIIKSYLSHSTPCIGFERDKNSPYNEETIQSTTTKLHRMRLEAAFEYFENPKSNVNGNGNSNINTNINSNGNTKNVDRCLERKGETESLRGPAITFSFTHSSTPPFTHSSRPSSAPPIISSSTPPFTALVAETDIESELFDQQSQPILPKPFLLTIKREESNESNNADEDENREDREDKNIVFVLKKSPNDRPSFSG